MHIELYKIETSFREYNQDLTLIIKFRRTFYIFISLLKKVNLIRRQSFSIKPFPLSGNIIKFNL